MNKSSDMNLCENKIEVSIRNCNNIESCTVEIVKNKFNIFYALNGTGKSTIANSIVASINGEKLDSFIPFSDSANGDDSTPLVTLSSELKTALVFNNNFIQTFLFTKNELIENSFEVFLHTPKYDEHMNKINALLAKAHNVFQTDEALNQFINDLKEFIEAYGKEKKDGGVATNSKLYKGIKNGDLISHIPSDIKEYSEFINGPNVIDWIDWQNGGVDFIKDSDKCPFCLADIHTKKDTIKKVSEIYKKSDVSYLKNILDVFDRLEKYFSKETKETVQRIRQDGLKDSTENRDYLQQLRYSAMQLLNRLNSIKSISFYTLKDFDTELQNMLQEKKVDLLKYPFFISSFTQEKIESINTALDEVLSTIGHLIGEVKQQKSLIVQTINKYESEINSFLERAGYKYTVSIENTENNYRIILKYGKVSVENPNLSLSYGERNAFALVLFMYQALKDNPDLIILDDPISSFDSNKKAVIMNMLLAGDSSLCGKTVLMLTHDFETILDISYTLNREYSNKVSVCHLSWNYGNLIRKTIRRENIKSLVQICKENIINASNVIIKLIYFRWLLELYGEKNLAWNLISNLFHLREIPVIQDSEKQFTEIQINDTEDAIKRESGIDFNYTELLEFLKQENNLIELYEKTDVGYEKVQIFRMLNCEKFSEYPSAMTKFINQSYHVQNNTCFFLNPKEFEIVPPSVLEYCDKEIKKMAIQLSCNEETSNNS